MDMGKAMGREELGEIGLTLGGGGGIFWGVEDKGREERLE